jgi:hypothetical protein
MRFNFVVSSSTSTDKNTQQLVTNIHKVLVTTFNKMGNPSKKGAVLYLSDDVVTDSN